MLSRITIEIDFENGNQPILQILKASSDDVRDKLVSFFTEQLGGSSWLQIKWCDPDCNPKGFQRIHISPIKEAQFKEQAEIMLEQYRLNNVS